MLGANIFYVLDSDKKWARQRIAEIEKEIRDLGPEFEEAFNQSSETWHDNAPFDALRDRQSLMSAERHNLRKVLLQAALTCPRPAKNKVGLGSTVVVKEAGKEHKYFIAGNWSPNTGHVVDGALVISCVSPLGSALFGKAVEQKVVIEKPPREMFIRSVQN